jgi:hypothetical protein
LGDQIKKNAIDRECSTYGGEVYTGFWWGNLRERDHLDDPDVDGRIILRRIFRNRDWGGMDWIHLAQDRDRWHAGCYKCGNEIFCSIKFGEFLPAENRLASQGLCSVEVVSQFVLSYFRNLK